MIAFLRPFLAALACLLVLPAMAAFIDNNDGTVTDTLTGLMWDKCSWGLSDPGTCTGGAVSLVTWDAALGVAVTANAGLHRGYGDWRLPNKNELESLVKSDAASPAIDTAIFPTTPARPYWTSTTYALDPTRAWYVSFTGGIFSSISKSAIYRVRLVRSGQSFGFFDSMADTTPDAFDITNLSNQPLSTAVTTNAITVAGLSVAVTAATTVGTIVKNGTDSGTSKVSVSNGDTVVVRLSTSASPNTATNVTLTIGSASDNFSVTTSSAVNAACGTVAATSFKPSTGLCASGTLSPAGVSLANGAWRWACDGMGAGGGTAANACSAGLAQTATVSGGAAAQLSGGTWTYAPSGTAANQTAGFIPITGHAKSPPSLPAGYYFPHGLFDFVLQGGAAGSTATITLTYPSALPAGTVYWKYGPEPGNATPHWYTFPAVITGNTVTLTLTDGALGDDDGAANGAILDAGGPGAPGSGTAIPTLSEWGMMLLSGLLLVAGWVQSRRQGRGLVRRIA